MARNLGRTGLRISAISSAITMLQLTTPTTIDVTVRDISVSFDGTVVTNAPIDVQTLFQTTGSEAFTGSTPAPTKVDQRTGTPLLCTMGYQATTEPTAGNEVFRWHVHPQTGQLWQGTPYMDEIVASPYSTGSAVAAKLGTKFATAPSAAVDTDIYFVFEE